ncbi:hypothetical protein EMCRGX_G028685 [Ephydatia muelleri]
MHRPQLADCKYGGIEWLYCSESYPHLIHSRSRLADETTRTEATTGTCNDLQVQSNEVIKLRVCNYQNKDMSYTVRTKQLKGLFLQDMALQQIAQINALLTEADRVEMRKSFGLREDYNPLLYIPADLYLTS